MQAAVLSWLPAHQCRLVRLLVAIAATDLLVGQDWDSRTFYEWTLGGKVVSEWQNPTGYVGYQDCRYVVYHTSLTPCTQALRAGRPAFALPKESLIDGPTRSGTDNVRVRRSASHLGRSPNGRLMVVGLGLKDGKGGSKAESAPSCPGGSEREKCGDELVA